MEIRVLKPTDWIDVKRIYEAGIATGFATFETQAPTWEIWNATHLSTNRLVAIVDHKVAGWVALSPVSSRCVYGGVGEVSVYVDTEYRGQQIGLKLLQKLIEHSERDGIWTLQSSIIPENQASIKLHEKAGFRKIGYREKIGKHHGIWKDNILFERRSKILL